MIKFSISLSFFFLLLCFIICCNKEEPNPDEQERNIAVDFKLDNSIWYFQQVSGEGVVLGSQRSGVDNNPQGFAQFNDDGTGNYSFDIKFDDGLKDVEYGKMDIPIEWDRISNERVLIVEIEQWERDTFYWELITANENIVKASWDIRILDNFATITAVLTPEP